MACADDLPWPELGNVSRGATRGNQGQKGVLGPPDHDGRCILQLRVQPGVLAVRLNRQASDWYRMLDTEVTRALKLTKTYWRKARRRQDYDARADQDHMELHEWLQQLKDKTMAHLELLMQKGDIPGPPYIMPDDIELTFLRKFIERQSAGVAHNPRLRNGNNGMPMPDPSYALRDHSVDSNSPDPDDPHGMYMEQSSRSTMMDHSDASILMPVPRLSLSPSLRNSDTLSQEASTSKQTLQHARTTLARTQKDTQDAFLRYTACLEAERQARQAVAAAEKRRDDVMTALLSMNQADQQSRHSSVSLEDHQGVRYHTTENPNDMKPRKGLDWSDADGQNVFGPEAVAHLEDHARLQQQQQQQQRKRSWDSGALDNTQYACEDMLPPQRKRIHIMQVQGYDVLNLQAQGMALQQS
ncbi:hypothetical protein C8J56DRAFT_429714 [Mycena floridula]|nr:hypothetical protein C8J56DRAFT_429714 [Mycena floridula]